MPGKSKGLIGRHVIQVTPAMAKKFYEYAKQGVPISAAAVLMGWDRETFLSKIKHYPSAIEAWARGNAELLAQMGSGIVDAASGNKPNLRAQMFLYDRAAARFDDQAKVEAPEGSDVDEITFRRIRARPKRIDAETGD